MMRDLRFRAFNGERMLFMGKGGYCDFTIQGGDIYEVDSIGYEYHKKDYPLMQSTGLKDKNNRGKELFEDDVVDIYGTGSCKVVICPMMGVTFEDIHGDEQPYHDNLMESDIGEILGNIHSNPELMEASK